MLALYVTHPEVEIDPSLPSTEWRLAEKGRQRTEDFVARSVLPATARIIASTERKTMETATILSRGGPFDTDDRLRENDRSATGYVGPGTFAALFDAMFARPDVSAGGWEPALATQRRAVAAHEAALDSQSSTTIFVGHGSAGTFLKCAIAGRPISRSEEQRGMAWPGGGNVFVFDCACRNLVRDWQSFEDFAPLSV